METAVGTGVGVVVMETIVSAAVGLSVITSSMILVSSTKFSQGSTVPATVTAAVGTTLAATVISPARNVVVMAGVVTVGFAATVVTGTLVIATLVVTMGVVTDGAALSAGTAVSSPDKNVQPALHNAPIRTAAQILI